MARSTLKRIALAVPSDGAGSGGGAGSSAIVMYGVVVGAFAPAAMVGKLVDLRREQDRQAARLQVAISNALFTEARGLAAAFGRGE
jgi:hypothetical protein